MELHFYTRVGYGIVKLYSLRYVYGRHVHTHYRICIMQNFMKKAITQHRTTIKSIKDNLKQRFLLRVKAFRDALVQ